MRFNYPGIKLKPALVDGEVSPLFPLSAPTKLYSTVMFASALCLVLLNAILLAMGTPGGVLDSCLGIGVPLKVGNPDPV